MTWTDQASGVAPLKCCSCLSIFPPCLSRIVLVWLPFFYLVVVASWSAWAWWHHAGVGRAISECLQWSCIAHILPWMSACCCRVVCKICMDCTVGGQRLLALAKPWIILRHRHGLDWAKAADTHTYTHTSLLYDQNLIEWTRCCFCIKLFCGNRSSFLFLHKAYYLFQLLTWKVQITHMSTWKLVI